MTTAAGPADSRSLDFGRCFSFVVEDPDWLKKVLIGGAFTLASLLIVGAFFVAGYWVRFVREVARGGARRLPEWDDLGGLFGDGVKLVGVYFVYTLGVVAVVAALGCTAGLLGVGIGGLSDVSEGAGSAAAALGGLGLAAAYGVVLLASLALMVYLPAVFVRVALEDDFAAGFAFARHLAFIRDNLGNYALSIVLYLVASFLSQFGALLCCVGIFPAVFWSYLVLGYALGETVRLGPRAA